MFISIVVECSGQTENTMSYKLRMISIDALWA